MRFTAAALAMLTGYLAGQITCPAQAAQITKTYAPVEQRGGDASGRIAQYPIDHSFGYLWDRRLRKCYFVLSYGANPSVTFVPAAVEGDCR